MPRRRGNIAAPPKDLAKRVEIESRAKYRDKDLERDPDPGSREYFHDIIDDYHDEQDKILLNSDLGKKTNKQQYEAVLDLSDEDESEEEDDFNDYYSRMAQKDEIASDIESENDEDLPNDLAWGKKKGLYYNTDYVDQDYGGIRGSDEEMAEAEEMEALIIQKRLLEQLGEEDFGLEWMKPPEMEKGSNQIEGRIEMNLSQMNKAEKLELLKKESPEFLTLIEDFPTLLTEAKEVLEPLVLLIKEGKFPSSSGSDYVLLKHRLIILYCINISFYMVLKCKGVPIQNHPILKRLATFKKLLQQLEETDAKMKTAMDLLLEKFASGEKISFQKETEIVSQPKKKLQILKKLEKRKPEEKTELTKKPDKRVKFETEGEKEAIAMYELMKAGRKKGTENSSEDELDKNLEDEQENEELNEETEDWPNEEFEGETEKRGISYQIAKNKGLTPHRKKENRNPRVKHRMKFKKAKIRRKGQVKEPRKEMQRYGGELSGIRIGVKHGIKLK